MDLVDDALGDVRGSASVTPDQDVPSDSVENHATMEGTIEPSDEMEPGEKRALNMTELNDQRGRTSLSRLCQLGLCTRGDPPDPDLQLLAKLTVSGC